MNEIIVQASHDTGACYRVSKCAESPKKKMKTLDWDENEIYKFLGIEQADGIKTSI